MKNRIIWEEKDIECGLFIVRESANLEINDGFKTTVCFKLGYCRDTDKKYGLCNFLTDGWYHSIGKTKQEVVEYLNNDEYGYRPLLKTEVIELFTKFNQGFL